MNKMRISFVALAALLAISSAGQVLAQEVAEEETITIQDLGVSEPTVLPTSPLYFFKEMGRGLQGFFTFNQVAKAELELKFANEKAAEVKKVSETQPQNAEAIQGALENYQKTQTKLRVRLEGLKETSQNPNIDKLLNNLTDRVVKHEKLFDEISFKFKEKENIKEAVRKTMEGSESVIGEAAKKDDAAKFASRLEKVLLKEKGGELKHVRSMEIIDRFSGKAPTEIKDALGRLREEFSERLKLDIEDLMEKKGEEILKEKITGTPGDFAKRSVIIEEIQKRAGERLSQTLERAKEHLETSTKINDEKAKEQIERAEKIIQEAEKKIQPASTLLKQAKEHLSNAKSAFEQKKYGEAFGQARSAEVLARNALRSFEKEKPETENFERHLSELAEKIRTYENLLKERNFTREQNKDAYELLDNAVLHLGYAKDNFAKSDLGATKLHIGHVKGFLSRLANILEGKVRPAAVKPTLTPTRTLTPAPTAKPTETPTPTAIKEIRLEADDSGFYPDSTIRVAKGTKVKLTFFVRTTNVYYGGLDIRSDVFKTAAIKPGNSGTVEFTTDESFEFTSWWPLSNVKKTTGKIVVE